MQNNENIVVAAVKNGYPLYQASEGMRNNKKVVLEAVKCHAGALEYASEGIQDDKAFVLEALVQNGEALQYPSQRLRGDRDCVLRAVQTTPGSARFAAEGLVQQDLSIMQNVVPTWTRVSNQPGKRAEKGILSVKFSLAETSTPYATTIASELKKHLIVGEFELYFPSLFNKNSCDPDFTDMDHPCRGTTETCQMAQVEALEIPDPKKRWDRTYVEESLKAARSDPLYLRKVKDYEHLQGSTSRSYRAFTELLALQLSLASGHLQEICWIHDPD